MLVLTEVRASRGYLGFFSIGGRAGITKRGITGLLLVPASLAARSENLIRQLIASIWLR